MKVYAHNAKSAALAKDYGFAGIRRIIDIFTLAAQGDGLYREVEELESLGMGAIYTIRSDADTRYDDPSLIGRDVLKKAVAMIKSLPVTVNCCNEPAGGPGQIQTPEALEAWLFLQMEIGPSINPAYATLNPLVVGPSHQNVIPSWRWLVQDTLFNPDLPMDVHLHAHSAEEIEMEIKPFEKLYGKKKWYSTEFGIAKHDPTDVRGAIIELGRMFDYAKDFEIVCYAPFHPHKSNPIFQWSAICDRDGHPNMPFAAAVKELAEYYNDRGNNRNSSRAVNTPKNEGPSVL